MINVLLQFRWIIETKNRMEYEVRCMMYGVRCMIYNKRWIIRIYFKWLWYCIAWYNTLKYTILKHTILTYTTLIHTILTGRSADHPLVQEVLKQYFPYEVYMNETTGNATSTHVHNSIHYSVHQRTEAPNMSIEMPVSEN